MTYRVVGVLGRGGMSVVELAEDTDGKLLLQQHEREADRVAKAVLGSPARTAPPLRTRHRHPGP